MITISNIIVDEEQLVWVKKIIKNAEERAIYRFKSNFVTSLTIGPCNEGFAIWFGQESFGWWKTRELACEEGKILIDIIQKMRS